MKKITNGIWLLLLLVLAGGWTSVYADEPIERDLPSLKVTEKEISVELNDEINVMDWIISGRFDHLELPLLDTTTPGYKNLIYISELKGNTLKVHKTVFVKDTIAPTIEGEDEITLKFKSDYDLISGYSASDNVQEGLEFTVDESELQREVHGDYEVTFKAVDKQGNETTKVVKVHVQEDPEVIALRERNAAYKTLVSQATTLNNALLVNTNQTEISNMLTRVNEAKAQESDYKSELNALSSELAAKLQRANEAAKKAAAEKAAREKAAAQRQAATTPSTTTSSSANLYSIAQFERAGIIYWGGYKYSYYSERVLSGRGLNIPGRHTSGGFVRDGSGNLVGSSRVLPKGTVVPTPFGAPAIIRDYCAGCASNQVDIYTR